MLLLEWILLWSTVWLIECEKGQQESENQKKKKNKYEWYGTGQPVLNTVQNCWASNEHVNGCRDSRHSKPRLAIGFQRILCDAFIHSKMMTADWMIAWKDLKMRLLKDHFQLGSTSLNTSTCYEYLTHFCYTTPLSCHHHQICCKTQNPNQKKKKHFELREVDNSGRGSPECRHFVWYGPGCMHVFVR